MFLLRKGIFDVKYKLRNKLRKNSSKRLENVLFYAFLAFVVIVTIWIYVGAPTQKHFREAANNDVWFGDDWHYVGEDGQINTDTMVMARSEHYMRLDAKDDCATITKVIDFQPSGEDYFCFRVRAQSVYLYVNGELWYSNVFSEEYKPYTIRMYMLHQISATELKPGDVITLSLSSEDVEHFIVQFPAIGDRYALTHYIIRKAAPNLLICVFVIILIILIMITRHSPILIEKMQSGEALKWLVSFLSMAVIYLSFDSGCMEILVNRMAVTNWLTCVSMLMLPMPFIMYTKSAFFPEHKLYGWLSFINFIIVVASIIGYIGWSYNIAQSFIFVHILIGCGIVGCVLSFIKERMIPGFEVVVGYAAVCVTALISVLAYWKGIIYPASSVFGIGLVIFGLCMLLWTVRDNNEMKRLHDEAERIRMRRAKEAAEEASEQKSRFLSQMSHEIRTPLNAMLGMSELIIREAQTDSVIKYASNIQSAGRTLLALINDILDFSKIENGKLDIVVSDYSLSSVLNDVILMVQERAAGKGLEMKFDIDPKLPDHLRGDEIRIKQIILNLMTNAAKYTERGWIKLAVNMTKVSDAPEKKPQIYLNVRVSDSGIGIKEEEKSKLFQEFERLDRKKNKSIEGTGLGLSITSQLVALMDGTISVESEYGKGSVFTVSIPQTVVSSETIGDYQKRFQSLSRTEQQEITNIACFPGKKVFVIDDNEMNLEVIASILEMLEITVSRADSGQGAINCLEKEKFDLILTDDMMPGMNGTELMEYIKSRQDGINHSTPIVVLTANAIAGVREEYIKKGFDEYMTKPIDIDVLQRILKQYLGD